MNDRTRFVLVISLAVTCCLSVLGMAVVAALGQEPPAALSNLACACVAALGGYLIAMRDRDDGRDRRPPRAPPGRKGRP